METYSVWADLLHTFRVMSDGVKISLIYMPCVFALGFAGLYMHHLRQTMKANTAPEPKAYTILPPEKTPEQDADEARLKALRRLDAYIATAERIRKM